MIMQSVPFPVDLSTSKPKSSFSSWVFYEYFYIHDDAQRSKLSICCTQNIIMNIRLKNSSLGRIIPLPCFSK